MPPHRLAHITVMTFEPQGLLIRGNDTKRVFKIFTCSFRALEGTWRAMSSTLTAVLSPGRTQHVHPCAATKTASPLTFVLHLPCTLTGCDTAGAGQHRLIRSAPSRPADVAVAQNDLPYHHARQGLALYIAHPASRSMTSPSPFDKFTVGNLSAERTFRTEKGNLL